MPRRPAPRRPGPAGWWWDNPYLVPALVLLLVALLVAWLAWPDLAGPRPRPAIAPAPSAGGYLFCTWNVENLFDDEDDPRLADDDEDWFGRHPEAVREKVAHLADALLRQNEGRGPDILAVVEVENRRAVELLRDALNARLPTEWRYTGLVHRDNRSGRRIEPAILTRLPVEEGPDRDFGTRRILEARIVVDGAPLVVLASHWTSRLRGRAESDDKREQYAAALYDAFLERRRRDSDIDLLICGDFNDEPDDASVRDGLRALGDPARVRARSGDARPPLLDLMIGRDPERFGTYYYRGHWQIFDHVVASPGLLDPAGWLVVPETLETARPPDLRTGRDGRPFRFGGPKWDGPRGYSDHFAVTVRLRVGGGGGSEQ